MSKYIIKNCPAFNDMPNMYDEIYGYCDNEHGIDLNKCMCENITDCVLKQIVELCKPVKEEYSKHKLDALIAGKFNIAGKILLLLDIQEVE